MSRKYNLKQFQIITAGDMSQASITSTVTNIQFLDNIGVQFDWTGSPSGTLAVQISANYNQDNEGNVTNAGTWVTISSTPTSAGSPVYIDLTQLSAPWIRALYTKSSGTGTLTAVITAKMI